MLIRIIFYFTLFNINNCFQRLYLHRKRNIKIVYRNKKRRLNLIKRIYIKYL